MQATDTDVQIWEERVAIPTYGIGKPDRNPMFLEKRVYQGSSGAVYPLPVIDRIEDEKRDKLYTAVFLENEFLKIMVLPELGGRVQMALDKTNDYHFVYYNHVIKPALVGLAGPWISGGIEFNWPQHHRPGTFSPVAYELEEAIDGACTVWLSEIDRLCRTKGMHGLTLHPGKAYLEVHVKLFNRTSEPQTFLWWANPAIHVDENHQSIFPPDVNAVMDHGKRDTSSFPIATGTYYKVDYSPGTDISRYMNIPVPTSYMAHHSDYDFVGSYDHNRQAGLLHVANHHISPGKKQWTWGAGDFGYAWDRHLTDQDGPYIELMTGVYTDNQPDFSWLAPLEEKSFTQVFMPYKGVGLVKNATVDAAVGLDVGDGRASVRVYTTSRFLGARVSLTAGGQTLYTATFDASPCDWFAAEVAIDPAISELDLNVRVVDAKGRELVSYKPQPAPSELPEPAKAIDRPERLDSAESLYLAGLHLEQYRHATREPEDYYREGLRRDPGDARCNNALGLLLYRRGRFDEAEACSRLAIERVTQHNPNPYDGEPYYNLGIALEAQERYAEATAAYYKATWNGAWQGPAYFALGRLACREKRWVNSLELLDRALAVNANNHKATHLKICVLNTLGREEESSRIANEELSRDPFNTGVIFEQVVMAGKRTSAKLARTANSAALTGEAADRLLRRLPARSHDYLELAIDYAVAGVYESAIAVLEHYLERVGGEVESPLVYYYLADFLRRVGDAERAATNAEDASTCDPLWCFPNRLESIGVLERAMVANPQDARAPYYLGNLWYSKRQRDRAIACWETARSLDPQFPTVWRNLALAYFNKRHDAEAAWEALEKAFALDRSDARVLYELDQLAKRLGHDPRERLERLDSLLEQVHQRDDLYLEHVTLLNQLGQHQAVLDAILARRFHPWEGGEGKVPAQFVLAATQIARRALGEGRPQEALDLLRRIEVWPESLGEGKLIGIQENDIHYLVGCAYRALDEVDRARAYFETASAGSCELTAAMYYNDQPPDMIYYQGLAHRELGNEEKALETFRRLIAYGQERLEDDPEIDFFAVSLPDFLVFDDNLQVRNEMHCRYLMALGYHGLDEINRASEQYQRVLDLDVNHQRAAVHFDLLRETKARSI